MSTFGTTVFDENSPVEPGGRAAPAAVPKRRRGRPFGSVARVTSGSSGINASETAFLRAVVQGIPAKAAADRYLMHLEPMDTRRTHAYLRELRNRISVAVLASPLRAQGEPLLAVLDDSPDSSVMTAVTPPLTLEEFAAGFDPDMFSEQELLAMYKEEVGDTSPPPTSAPVLSEKERLRAKLDTINWVQAHIASHPKGHDPIAIWLHSSFVEKLRMHGVMVLSDMVNWINLQGRRWYNKLPGVGRGRAARLTRWLVDNQDAIGVAVNGRIAAWVCQPEEANANPPVAEFNVVNAHQSTQVFGIVPLETLAWPLDLMKGQFTSATPNTLNAHNDVEAVRAWFSGLRESSPATVDGYRRAIERLALWAIVERQKALSSLSTQDFMDFKDFLRNPPAHWCQRAPLMKSSQDWRPLRGPLKDVSIQQTMSAISRMFRDWHSSGYLMANAVAGVRGARRKEMKLDVMRSFSDQALRAIRETLYQMPDGPSRRRLRAAILLLQTAGLRRAEVTSVTWGQMEKARLGNHESDVWAIRFSGKGNRERVVPINPVTFEALEAHYKDRLDLIESGDLSRYAHLEKEAFPLLGILDERLACESAGTPGDLASNAMRRANNTGALSASRLHGILKAFFKKTQGHPDAIGTDFDKASAHWLRHTFAHQTLESSDKNLPVVQQLLGHADISTTAIYVKADMTARVDAVLGVRAAV